MFWILVSVLDSGKCFGILGSVLDSGKCFVPMGHRKEAFFVGFLRNVSILTSG